MIRFTVNSTAPALKKGSVALDSEPDPQLARDALPSTLKTTDVFLAAHPKQPLLLELVAQGKAQYAFGFLEDDIEQLKDGDPKRAVLVERATLLYESAFDAAMRRIALEESDFPASFKADMATFEKELKGLDGDSGPGLYWAGLSLVSIINLHRDDVDRVAELPRAVALLERAHQVAPAYFNHGAALALGVVYSSQAKAMGGKPELAKQMFDEVTRATGGKYLMAKVLFARFYAVIQMDRDLFEKTLKEVLATPANVWPEQRLANELARRRAARYLKMAEDLF